MQKNASARNELGTKSVGKLLLQFSVPSMISMLVNSLYNLVDQIFIGQGVGYLGNAATNVAFPFVTLSLALALLVSDGCAANMSLSLGAGDQEKANKGLAGSLLLAATFGILLFAVGSIFLTPLLRLFGSTETVLPYAQDYTRITLLGMPFVIVSITLSAVIRADGSPRYAMVCMLVGALINTVLDPLFIFVFRWGVKGAAWATIIGQFANFLLTVRYLFRLRHVRLVRKYVRYDLRIMGHVCLLGISSFINQVAIMLVQIVVNNTVTRYGAQSIYGADIPLTCFGIVMKVNQIIAAFIIGIGSGAQPIVGFNYGAGQYARVRRTYALAVSAATFFSVVGFLVFQLIPDKIILLFGQENALYNEFAVLCFRRVLLCVFALGFQMVTSGFFQSIGKAKISALLSLSRQVMFLIPLMLLLPLAFGLNGALFAFPIADTAAALLAAVFVVRELRLLRAKD